MFEVHALAKFAKLVAESLARYMCQLQDILEAHDVTICHICHASHPVVLLDIRL